MFSQSSGVKSLFPFEDYLAPASSKSGLKMLTKINMWIMIEVETIKIKKEKMKNLQNHKVQILAALALAFSLGMMVPSATYAAEGSGDVETQADGGSTSDKKTLGLAASIAALYNKVQNDESFAGYQKAIALINAVDAYAPYTESAETVLKKVDGTTDKTLWASLSEATQKKLAGKTGVESIAILKDSDDYTTLGTQIDALGTAITNAQTTLAGQVKALRPTVTGVDDMTGAALINAAKGLDKYDEYAALYKATDFVRAIATAGTDLTEADVKAKLPNETMQMTGYNAMAVAAVAINPKATEGLYSYTLPETSVGGDKNEVEAPNTGIVGLIESGALDMGTITLIVSVAVASVAGLGLIAKLYLKHKF